VPTEQKVEIVNKAGHSIYPIEPGVVFLTHDIKSIINPQISELPIDHYEYIWIHALCKIRINMQPKMRKVNIARLLVPVPVSFRKMVQPIQVKTVRFDYLTMKFSKGFDVVGEAKWDRNKDTSYRRFYKLLELI